jgi:hypothetical protein
MIEASYLGTPVGAPLDDAFNDKIPSKYKQPIDRALVKISRIPDKFRRYQVVLLFKLVQNLGEVTRSKELRENVLEYLEIQLANMYPDG